MISFKWFCNDSTAGIPINADPQTSKGTVDRLVGLEAANVNSGGTLLVIRAASCGN
jgi:hypothetical protein